MGRVVTSHAQRGAYLFSGFLCVLVGVFFYLIFYYKVGGVPLLEFGDLENSRVQAKAGNGELVLLGNGFIYVGCFFLILLFLYLMFHYYHKSF